VHGWSTAKRTKVVGTMVGGELVFEAAALEV